MAIDRIATEKSPLIDIETCKGDLVVRPWMELAVQAKGEYQFEHIEEGIRFNAIGDLHLNVPEGASLKVGVVSGDLVVKNLHGDLSISEVYGDVVLLNLGGVKINLIHGDLSAKNIRGPISVETIDGDVVLRDVDNDVSIDLVNGDLAAYYINGTFSLNEVAGDVSLRTINGDVGIDLVQRDVNFRNLGGINSVHKVLGDIRLIGGLAAGKHEYIADGDIVVRWPVDAPINLIAKAPEVRIKLALQNVKELEDGITGNIGDGDTNVQLTAGGKILLKDYQLIDEKWNAEPQEIFGMGFMNDLAGLGERVSAEVNQHLSRMTNHLETHFGPDFAQNISSKVSQQAEKAARQAERAAEKARKYAEREAARAERGYHTQRPSSSASEAPNHETTKTPASTEEQLKILKMVEKGTISPDEANTLLEALEG